MACFKEVILALNTAASPAHRLSALVSLVIVLNSDFTDVEWGAADRSALGRQRPLSSKGRRTISKQSPNGCLGRLSPHLARKGLHLRRG